MLQRDALLPRRVGEDDDGVGEALEAHGPLSNLADGVRGRLFSADLLLELEEVDVEIFVRLGVELLEDERSHEEVPFGDVPGDRREAFPA